MLGGNWSPVPANWLRQCMNFTAWFPRPASGWGPGVGQPVPHRNPGVLAPYLDGSPAESPVFDAVERAAQDPGGVLHRLHGAELEVMLCGSGRRSAWAGSRASASAPTGACWRLDAEGIFRSTRPPMSMSAGAGQDRSVVPARSAVGTTACSGRRHCGRLHVWAQSRGPRFSGLPTGSAASSKRRRGSAGTVPAGPVTAVGRCRQLREGGRHGWHGPRDSGWIRRVIWC